MALNDSQIVQEELYFLSFNWVIFSLIVNTCISSLIGILGLIANVINMIVFFQQGLNNSINISLFSMAISDLLTIIFVLWANVCFNPYIESVVVPFNFGQLYYLTGGWPSGFSCRVTLYITVYITAERCLCILLPLKIKTLITPVRTKIIIAIINVLNAMTLVPEYSSLYLSWEFNKEANATLLGIAFRNNRVDMQGVSFLMHVILVVIGQSSIIVLTIVLILHLRRQTEWRLKSCGDSGKNSSYLSRDRKSQVLVVVVATSVVISYIPLTCVSLVSVFVTEFSIGGRFAKIFVDTWSTIFIFGLTNASSNILIYYNMNSRFRTTLRGLLNKQSNKEGGQ